MNRSIARRALLLLCLPMVLWAGCARQPPAAFIPGESRLWRPGRSGEKAARLQLDADRTVESVSQRLGLAEPTAPATVLIFGSRAALREFLEKECPKQADAPAACFETPEKYVVALSEQWTQDDTLRYLRHELTHYVIAAHFYDVPPWVDEGLAQYFELGPPYGRPHPECLRSLAAQLGDAKPGMLAHLVSLPAGARLSRKEYSQAWGLVWFLMAQTSDGADSVRRYLQQVRAEDNPEEQFRSAFGRSPSELEADFRRDVRQMTSTGRAGLSADEGRVH